MQTNNFVPPTPPTRPPVWARLAVYGLIMIIALILLMLALMLSASAQDWQNIEARDLRYYGANQIIVTVDAVWPTGCLDPFEFTIRRGYGFTVHPGGDTSTITSVRDKLQFNVSDCDDTETTGFVFRYPINVPRFDGEYSVTIQTAEGDELTTWATVSMDYVNMKHKLFLPNVSRETISE